MCHHRVLCALMFLIAMTSSARAEPLPGQVSTFLQAPLIQRQIFADTYFGHAEPSTMVQLPLGAPFDGYSGVFMADDFAVQSAQPIAHIRWWGAYRENLREFGAQRFFVSIEQNNPAAGQPGAAILSQFLDPGPIAPASGTFTEKPIHPGGSPLNEQVYEYHGELAVPFLPQPNTVYWLKIVALAPQTGPDFQPAFQWGWRVRDYAQQNLLAPTPPAVDPGEFGVFSPIPEIPPIWHFQGSAAGGNLALTDHLNGPDRFVVNQTQIQGKSYTIGWDGPSPLLQRQPLDLAFELFAIPEPSTLSLLATALFAGPAVFCARLRRRFARRS